MKLEVYPDWTARALREKIAAKYGYAADQVICGAGETEIISWIIRVFSAPGDKVLMFVPAFPIYHMTAENEGRAPVFVGMGDDLDFKWDDYVAAIKDDVRIVFLTNPHSPTGRLIPLEQIRRVCNAAKNQLVVLDEAYIHFSRTNGGMDLVKEFKNLIVLRTFSKVFGLAGLRIGFGVASPDIIAPMMHIKPTWNMGQLQVAGAVAALDDDEFVNKTIDAIAEMRAYVMEKIGRLNRFSVVGQPISNFFLLRIEDGALDFDEGIRGAAQARRHREGRLGVLHRPRQALSADRCEPQEADGSSPVGALRHPPCGLIMPGGDAESPDQGRHDR